MEERLDGYCVACSRLRSEGLGPRAEGVICGFQDGIRVGSGIPGSEMCEIESVEVVAGGQPAGTAADDELVAAARWTEAGLRYRPCLVVFDGCRYIHLQLREPSPAIIRIHTVLFHSYFRTSFLALTDHLRSKQPDNNLLPEIRKARVGKYTLHTFAQGQLFYPVWIRGQQTYFSLEMRARVVAQGPLFQVFQECSSLVCLCQKPICRLPRRRWRRQKKVSVRRCSRNRWGSQRCYCLTFVDSSWRTSHAEAWVTT